MKKISFLLLFFIVSSCINKSSSDITLQDLILLQQIQKSQKKGSTVETLRALESGEFYIYSYDKKKSIIRDFTEVKKTKNFKIFVEKGIDIASKTISDYETELEDKIYPTLIKNFGSYEDVDEDGKINVVISKSLQEGNTNDGIVAGYVSPLDYTNASGSNKGDFVYINYRLFQKSIESVYQTTAHELQHLFRLKYMDFLRDPDSLWINEGSSDYIASEIYGPLSDRISCFNGSNNNATSCSYGANNASVFDRTGTLGLYSFRYAFMSYLFHASSGTKEERENFFYKVTTGKDKSGNSAPTRAKNAENLFKSFKYAKTYDGNTLGSTYDEIFYKLYSGFLLQSAGSNLSKYVKIASKGSGATKVDFTNIISKYPLPSFFQQNNQKAKDNKTALKIRLFQYSSVFKYDDRSANISYFAIPTSEAKVFQAKDNILAFNLKSMGISGTAGEWDIFLRINTAMKSQGTTIQPSITSLSNYLSLNKENSFSNYDMNFSLGDSSSLLKPPETEEHDHHSDHFGCIYAELNKDFISKFHKNQYQLLSDE